MPAGPGDSCLTTLFADVHYYFSPPTSKPQHHRFSRASYFYIFHNAGENRAKIEIANHAGTAEQDAFSGSLANVARLSYSYKQPNLFTLTVDGASIQGHEEWHIPSYNETNEQKYLYKINTLDVYIWTEADAATLLKYLKALLPADRLDIKDAPVNLQTPPPAEHRDSMSPVVQQLERTAVGAQFPPRSGSTTSAVSLPGPLTPATSIGGTTSSPQPAQAQAPAPMAYNPAAPAAPETRIHREKTPPPMDDGTGTGLTNAAKYDSLPQPQYANVPNNFTSAYQHTPQQAYFSGPPQQAQNPSIASFPGPPSTGTPPQRTQSGALPPPPPPPSNATSPPQQSGHNPSFSSQPTQQQQAYNPSFAGPPTQQQPTSPPPSTTSFNRQSTQFGSAPGQTQYAQYNPAQRTPSFGPAAMASPGMAGGPPTPSAPPAYTSPGLPPPPSQQSQAQVFGYSTYSYQNQNQGQAQAQSYNPGAAHGYAGAVHEQLDRPTEAEANAHGRPQAPRVNSERRDKLEGRVRDVEGKVGGYLKRLDKLW